MSPYIDPEVNRAYQRGWAAGRRAMFFEDKVCAGCGADDALQLHHVDRREKVAHSIWNWSYKRRTAEIAKCVPLCPDCHYDEHRDLFRTAPADKAVSTPGGSRTRATAVRGQHPRPLDDGGMIPGSSPKSRFSVSYAGLPPSCLEPVFTEDADA